MTFHDKIFSMTDGTLQRKAKKTWLRWSQDRRTHYGRGLSPEHSRPVNQ